MTEDKNKTANENADKTPATQTFPIEINGEVMDLSAERVTELLEKGLKFEIIEKDYETLKNLAAIDSKSVAEYLDNLQNARLETRKNELLEKCGGDVELTKHFLALEQAVKKETENDLNEIKEFFPNINSLEQLPKSVRENSSIKGTKLLDEYLRYLLAEKKKQKEAEDGIKNADKKSMGSLINKSGAVSPEAAEFLKGLWK